MLADTKDDDYGKIAAAIHRMKLTIVSPLVHPKLVQINCAYRQVVDGFNYNVTAVFDIDDSAEICELKYFENSNGQADEDSIDVTCHVPDNCDKEFQINFGHFYRKHVCSIEIMSKLPLAYDLQVFIANNVLVENVFNSVVKMSTTRHDM